jgi:hypothetical protein
MTALDGPAVGQLDDHAGLGPLDRIGAGMLDQGHTTLVECFLQHERSILVLVREYAVAAGHGGHLDAHLGVRGHELGARDTRTDDDQVFGKRVEVIELTPVEDAFSVRLGALQDSGARAGRDQYDVGVENSLRTVGERGANLMRCHADLGVDHLRATGDEFDPDGPNACRDVGGLRLRQGLHTFVNLRKGNRCLRRIQRDPQVAGTAHFGAYTGGRDERLRRHAVPQHAGATDSLRVDERHRSPVLRRHQCCFVPSGSATDDHDPGH